MSAVSTNGASRTVVGVDGSPSSRTALRWAVRQANLTNGTVDAVIAWEIPMVIQSYGFAPIYVEEEGSFEENAKNVGKLENEDHEGVVSYAKCCL